MKNKKKIGNVIEPTLVTPTQIEISDADKKREQEWLDDFLRGADILTQQELNDKAIAQILSEKTDNPQIDGKIEHMFIADNERFYKYELTEKRLGIFT